METKNKEAHYKDKEVYSILVEVALIMCFFKKSPKHQLKLLWKDKGNSEHFHLEFCIKIYQLPLF